MIMPLPFVWPYFPVFWLVFVWVCLPEMKLIKRSTSNGLTPEEDRGSMPLIRIGFNASMMAALAMPFIAPWAALPGRQANWFIVGILVLISGSLLRRHCFKVLGEFFNGAVTVRVGHQVIDSGAYRWLRHPSYSAAFLILAGIALAAGNWMGILVSLLIALPVYIYRVVVEEKALIALLGTSYEQFLSTRKRFIPFIY